jgi:hypothetical protein
MEIVCVTIDSDSPASVAHFWNAALGWRGVSVHPDGTAAICRQANGGSYLEFVRVPEGKAAKNRVHLGCTAGALNQVDAEILRLQALGASIAWEEEFPSDIAAVYRNVVLRDVEGNEFCLSGGSFPPSDLPTVAHARD